jgi:hypothetical protein
MMLNKLLSILILTFVTTAVMAGNDPSIKGQQRTTIKSSMQNHISNSLIKGEYVIFDAKVGQIKRLRLKELHQGIVKKGDFYVSCADFVDAKGLLYDLDFLVTARDNGKYEVIQSLVHAVDGDKRSYHVEG